MELRLEVLHATALSGAEYRLGDLSCSLLGITDVRPYVEVKFQSQTQCSCPVQAKDGAVVFGWSTRFDVGRGERLCRFRVYDKRGAQSALRGDPLIGEAELPLVDRASREGLVATFKLRRQRATTGELTVHYELSRRPDGEAAELRPGNILLGTAFGDDMVCAGSGVEQKMLPCSVAAAVKEPEEVQKSSRRLSEELLQASRQATPEGPSRATSSTSLDQGLARSESSGSFHSAVEDPLEEVGEEPGEPAPSVEEPMERRASASSSAEAAPAPACEAAEPDERQRRCEGVAESYINARFQNNLDAIRGLFARDAVVSVPTPLGSTAEHRGWRGIEAYLLNNPAKPGCYSGWAHSRTQDGGSSRKGGPETTVVRWTGKIYKLGFWHHVEASIMIDRRQLLIRRVDLVRAQ